MTTTPLSTAATESAASGQDHAAFVRTASARMAVKPEDFKPFALQPFHAISTAQGIAVRVAPYRGAMIALPGFEARWLDSLDDYARSLSFVNTEIERRVKRPTVLPPLADEGWRLRGMMMAHAEGLTYTGQFAPELVAKLREGSGYADLVEDLKILVQEFLAIPGSPVTQASLDRASEIADQITAAAGIGTEIDLSQAALLDERRKIAGLLVQARAEIRRAIAYLRYHEGDAAELVPSLHVSGGGRRAAKPAAEDASELAEMHEQLHEHDPQLAPEDDPFTKE